MLGDANKDNNIFAGDFELIGMFLSLYSWFLVSHFGLRVGN